MIYHILILFFLILLVIRLLSLILIVLRRLNRFHGAAQEVLPGSAANRLP
jgi:hypothetical protein